MNLKALTLAAAAFSIGFIGEVDLSAIQNGGSVSVQVSEASAQTASQNTARRTARRTSRRHNNYD